MIEDKEPSPQKPLRFVVDSCRTTLRKFPKGVRSLVGQALLDAQSGDKHLRAKPLTGFGNAKVLEVVIASGGNAYRAIYTVQFAEIVYVIHVFQKKSKSGSKTPAEVRDILKQRFKLAQDDYENFLSAKDKI